MSRIALVALVLLIACAPVSSPESSADPSAWLASLATTTATVYVKGANLKNRAILTALVAAHAGGARIIALFERGSPRQTGSMIDELTHAVSGPRATVALATDGSKLAPLIAFGQQAFVGKTLLDASSGALEVTSDDVQDQLAQFENVPRTVYLP